MYNMYNKCGPEVLNKVLFSLIPCLHFPRKHVTFIGYVYRKEKVQWMFDKYNFILHIYFNFRSIYFSNLINFHFGKFLCPNNKKLFFITWHVILELKISIFLQLCSIFIYNFKKIWHERHKIIDFSWYQIKSYTWGVMVLYIYHISLSGPLYFDSTNLI